MAPKSQYACPRCNANVSSKSVQCGKCGIRIRFVPGKTKTEVLAQQVIHSESGFNSSSFGLSSMLLTITLIAVCLAMFSAAPGLGIIMAILSLPAFIRTLMVVQRKKSLGSPVSTEAKVGLYLGSFGVTLVVTGVTLFASALTFCLSCLGGLVVTNGGGGNTGIVIVLSIAIGFTIGVAGLLIWAFSKWIRQRWRRDTAKS